MATNSVTAEGKEVYPKSIHTHDFDEAEGGHDAEPDFEERLEEYRVNGAKGLHFKNDPLALAYDLTSEISGLLLTIGAGFEGDSPEVQTLNGEIVKSAFNGLARLARLANFYVDEAAQRREGRPA